MSFVTLDKLAIEVYGESHSEKIGARLTGIPAGINVDLSRVEDYLRRRKAKATAFSTKRLEPDNAVILSGLHNGTTDGKTIEIEIKNTSTRSRDYDSIQGKPRPSHADYPLYVKRGADYDISGGGAFSGRMTAPLVALGGIASAILAEKGIKFYSYVSEIGGIKSSSYKDSKILIDGVPNVCGENLPLMDDIARNEIVALIEATAKEGDSLGGVIECIACNAPVGIGDAMFNGIESKFASLMFGVPAVKGIEFGMGFDIATMKGSNANDSYRFNGEKIITESNNNGGIVGGMANGMPIAVRVAIKPTPSISKEQKTVDLHTKQNTTIVIGGRHDVCIVPRAVVCVESCLALALLDCIL